MSICLFDKMVQQILAISRGQRQIMHQIDSLSNLLRENPADRFRHGRTEGTNRTIDADSISVPLFLTLALGGLGIVLFKNLTWQK